MEVRPRALSTISIGDEAPRVVNAVIEIPRGSATKYEYREDLDLLCIDAENRSTLPFPADYGFIPRARSEDGDLLDIFVLRHGQVSPGTVVRARPVGMLDMADASGRDMKIIGIATNDAVLSGVIDIGDVEDEAKGAIEEFLRAYKRENGHFLVLNGWHRRGEACATIAAAASRYRARPAAGAPAR